MELHWHSYRYYPYERELAIREVRSLLSPDTLAVTRHGIRVGGQVAVEAADRLVYFSSVHGGERPLPTLQARMERSNRNGAKRQSTRYSAHGLHEYKGKFNPQIARAILNILDIPLGAQVFDPFCGSGTSLLECSHLGIKAIGTDLNPLAVYIANAKLSSLRIPGPRFRRAIEAAVRYRKSSLPPGRLANDERTRYLRSWFSADVHVQIEKLRVAIEHGDAECALSLFSIASNLLRDYSLQDPHDLRIRRRKSPLPERRFADAFAEAAEAFVSRLEGTQRALTSRPAPARALLVDTRCLSPRSVGLGRELFDCVLTSPPYATALPYIDTQRLSLVWLGLIRPSEILSLEARLVGSREIRGESRKALLAAMVTNRESLPDAQAGYCRKLQSALSDADGFRRQAVPLLLYRYFVGMADTFKSVRRCVKDGAPFALIVGRNHTVLGGKRFAIDTPRHLAAIAEACGWVHEETFPLQTYQRYGYHMSNAVASEDLVIVRAA